MYVTTIPTTEPSQVRAGDTVKWTRSLSDYLPDDSWVLTYVLRGPEGEIDITASDNGDGTHLVNVAPATTAAWAAGEYEWIAQVSDGTDVYTADYGTIVILPDLAEHSGSYDHRSWTKRSLDAVEAVLEGRASRSDQTYSIGTRQLQHMSHTELWDLRSNLQSEYKREQARERIRRGKVGMRKVKARL